MNRSPKRLTVAAVCLAATLLAFRPAPADPLFDFQQLAPDVWAAVLRAKGPYATTNSLIVMGGDGVLVVDTQQSRAAVQEVIAWIRQQTDAPVRWVVNTHEHLDHVGGNDAYREAFGAEVAILAHPAARAGVQVGTRTALADEVERRAEEIRDQRGQLERLRGNPLLPPEVQAQWASGVGDLEVYLEDLRSLQIVPATEVFDTERVLQLGGRSVHLIHPGPAHTRGDVVVWIPDGGILAVGDLLEDGLSLMGDLSTPTGWAAALDSLSRLPVTVLVPAHGPVQGRALLDRQRRLLGAVVAEVRLARREGFTLDEVWERTAAVAEQAIRSEQGELPVPHFQLLEWLERCVPRAWDEAG